MVLICISLMANDAECLFMYLSAIYLHWKKVFSDIYDLQIFFFPLCALSFYFPGSVLRNKNFLILMKSNLSIFQSLNKVRRTALGSGVIWRIRTHMGLGGHP